MIFFLVLIVNKSLKLNSFKFDINLKYIKAGQLPVVFEVFVE